MISQSGVKAFYKTCSDSNFSDFIVKSLASSFFAEDFLQKPFSDIRYIGR